MKKKIALIASALFVSAVMGAYAEFGIGVQGGYNWGSVGGAALLLSPNNHLHFAVGWYAGDGGFNVGVSADLWALDLRIVSISDGGLDFYVGPGLFVNVGMWKQYDEDKGKNVDKLHIAAGGRIPIGVNFRIQRLELFLQAVPAVGLSVTPTLGLYWGGFGGNIGIRFWL
ncbi:MAG: DUF3996 domain-containing protein [Spirochaetaceae bacterium]|jgi:hypothetical protein|nr:DUF3996 domain-containing protein [Spirochaetaceae bacterium]